MWETNERLKCVKECQNSTTIKAHRIRRTEYQIKWLSEFCVEQLAICVPWPLNKRFTILPIKEYKENSDSLDVYDPLSYIVTTLLFHWHRWKKKLSLWSTINALNVCRTFLETTNTSESLTIHVLVNSSTTRVFIDKVFVKEHCLNIHKLSKTILVYNVNGISNKAGQISQVVNMVLYC